MRPLLVKIDLLCYLNGFVSEFVYVSVMVLLGFVWVSQRSRG